MQHCQQHPAAPASSVTARINTRRHRQAHLLITFTLFNGEAHKLPPTLQAHLQVCKLAITVHLSLPLVGSFPAADPVQARHVLEHSAPLFTAMRSNAQPGGNNSKASLTGNRCTKHYQYSIDGTTPVQRIFTGLAAGVYTVTKRCQRMTPPCHHIKIWQNGPVVNLYCHQCRLAAQQSQNTQSITATGGTASLYFGCAVTSYIFKNVLFYWFNWSTYTITVKDANGCTNAVVVTITSFQHLKLQPPSRSPPCTH